MAEAEGPQFGNPTTKRPFRRIRIFVILEEISLEGLVSFPTRALLSGQAVIAALLFLSSSSASTKAQTPPKLHSMRDIGMALRSCMRPPPIAYPGMQMTVRFSFNVTGGIENGPRITYSTPGAPEQVRAAYERALLDSLNHCTPLPFSADLGAAIAGQPYVLRFIENRSRLPGVLTEILLPKPFSAEKIVSSRQLRGSLGAIRTVGQTPCQAQGGSSEEPILG